MIPLKYFRAMFFDDHSIEAIGSYATVKTTIFVLFFVVLLQSLPVTYDEIFTTHLAFAKIFIQFFGCIIVIFLISKLFKSSTNFLRFTYIISTVEFFAVILTTILAYLSLFLFEYLFDTPVVSNLVTSLLPFYIIVLFGFSADVAANVKKHSWLIGVLGVTLLYAVYFFL